MANPAGEADSNAILLDFDRRLMLRFCRAVVTSDAGLLAYRELDEVLRLTTGLTSWGFPCGLAANQDAGAQNGKNGARAAIGKRRRLAP